MNDDHHIITRGEPGYPARLLDLDDPPDDLYVRGSLQELESMKTVAIVGSRKATVRGVRLARQIACDLARCGIMVISGGALGVDAAAHRGCLDGQSPTVSVLAGGVDKPTPVRNASVFEAILGRGALISEYPPGTRPRRYHFHRRNDLIAALGDVTLVVRAGLKSGTMITARAARTLGRPLCAIPGALDDPLTEGCHQLLVDGAQCVRSATDVVEYALTSGATDAQLSLPVDPKPSRQPGSHSHNDADVRTFDTSGLSDDACALFEALHELGEPGRIGVARDRLQRELQWTPGRLNPAILELELNGAVSKRAGAGVFVPSGKPLSD